MSCLDESSLNPRYTIYDIRCTKKMTMKKSSLNKNKMNKKIVVGITGGLATGKSVVADMLVKKGAVKIDVDSVGHRLLADDNNVKRMVTRIFGKGILSGEVIDRVKLRNIVFADKEKLEALEGMLHPLMTGIVEEKIEAFKEGVLIIDAALLVEMGLDKLTDIVVVVTAERAQQVERAVDRGISREEAEKIIDVQMPLSERIRFADHIIDNSSDIDTTKKGVNKLWKKIQNL